MIKTFTAFKKVYYALLNDYRSTRHYIGAGKYKETPQHEAIANRLAELSNAYPDWAERVQDLWTIDQQINNAWPV